MKEHLLQYINKATSQSVRGLRILVEYFYALEIFEPIINSKIRIVSVFGSARSKPNQAEYKDAKRLGEHLYKEGFAVVTGGSQGVMKAANEGVSCGIMNELKRLKKFRLKSEDEIKHSHEFKKILHQYSVGLKISLPFEQEHNPYLGVMATFHYFMVRKFFFATLSSAFVACEGGWGTRDELFEMLTLVQTGKSPLMPIIYISSKPQHLLSDIHFSIQHKFITPEDAYLLDVVSDHKRAVHIVKKFYSVVKNINYGKNEKKIRIVLQKNLTVKQQKTVLYFVRKKYKNIFTDVSFGKQRIDIKGFNFRSYGILRRLIDALAD